jgi:hypothetical protein
MRATSASLWAANLSHAGENLGVVMDRISCGVLDSGSCFFSLLAKILCASFSGKGLKKGNHTRTHASNVAGRSLIASARLLGGQLHLSCKREIERRFNCRKQRGPDANNEDLVETDRLWYGFLPYE